ncbi:MAG: hypothetical protein NT178_08950 [Proteobacteria bacterium]|nr:hypothetical protein [Pseudomonadota bacterium]
MIENAYVCYADVLGFTSRFISGDLSSKYDKLIQMVNDIEDPSITVFLMSDSIIIVSLEFEKFRDTVKEFYTWGILNDFWLRGAITKGDVTRYHERAMTEQNRFILPFLGDGYLRAYAIETTMNISGIAIDQKFFDSDNANPGFMKGVDYIEHEEYLPKAGYEGKKKLLLPKEHSLRQVVDTMYFEEMLGSHVEDVDKYINTFCFYIRHLVERVSTINLIAFVEKIIKEFELQGGRILIPTKIVTIFIAMVEGLLNRYRSPDNLYYSNPDQLEMLVGKIISALKEQGYLPAFVDNMLDFDKKRRTTIYKEINSLKSHVHS